MQFKWMFVEGIVLASKHSFLATQILRTARFAKSPDTLEHQKSNKTIETTQFHVTFLI